MPDDDHDTIAAVTAEHTSIEHLPTFAAFQGATWAARETVRRVVDR